MSAPVDDQYVDSTRHDKDKAGGGYTDNVNEAKNTPKLALKGNEPAPPYRIVGAEEATSAWHRTTCSSTTSKRRMRSARRCSTMRRCGTPTRRRAEAALRVTGIAGAFT
jgi:hypothetical protein